PTAQTGDGRMSIKVISGSALGVSHMLGNHEPITYLHATLAPGVQWEQPIPTGHNALAYVLGGTGRFRAEKQLAREGQLILFEREGNTVSMEADGELSVLLLTGTPLGEPVARYGPFVMTTEAEIRLAIADYRNGRMGRITV